MTDIVDELARGPEPSPDVGTHLRKYQDLCDMAAAEITRLREDADDWQRQVRRRPRGHQTGAERCQLISLS